MSEHQQPKQAAVPMQSVWNNSLVQFLESTCNQQSGEIIKQVREKATMQYKVTKRSKQEELSYRVREAKRNGKTAFKNAKKKVDNHASSVATRSRRACLISDYEALVGKTMQESARLARLLLHQRSLDARKDEEIRRMQLKVHALTRELDDLKLHKSKNQSTPTIPSSSMSLNQESTWPQEFESLPYDTNTPTTTTSRYVHHNAVPFNSLVRTDLPDESFEDADEHDEQAKILKAYLERVAEQSPAESLPAVDNCLKADAADWAPPILFSYKDAQAQMKADTPNDILHPAV